MLFLRVNLSIDRKLYSSVMMSNSNKAEDDTHFTLKCPMYDDLILP